MHIRVSRARGGNLEAPGTRQLAHLEGHFESMRLVRIRCRLESFDEHHRGVNVVALQALAIPVAGSKLCTCRVRSIRGLAIWVAHTRRNHKV